MTTNNNQEVWLADIECVFKVKEEKLKENYEIIIKDLENKLGKLSLENNFELQKRTINFFLLCRYLFLEDDSLPQT